MHIFFSSLLIIANRITVALATERVKLKKKIINLLYCSFKENVSHYQGHTDNQFAFSILLYWKRMKIWSHWWQWAMVLIVLTIAILIFIGIGCIWNNTFSLTAPFSSVTCCAISSCYVWGQTPSRENRMNTVQFTANWVSIMDCLQNSPFSIKY